MQSRSQIVRAVAAATAVVLVSLVLMGASGHGSPSPAVPAAAVGVPTGEYANGVAIQRLPSITVTARHSDFDGGGAK